MWGLTERRDSEQTLSLVDSWRRKAAAKKPASLRDDCKDCAQNVEPERHDSDAVLDTTYDSVERSPPDFGAVVKEFDDSW